LIYVQGDRTEFRWADGIFGWNIAAIGLFSKNVSCAQDGYNDAN